MGQLIDIMNQRFGRLTVIKKSEQKSSCAMWECLCDCGSKIVARGTALRSGKTQSCGCYQRDRFKEVLAEKKNAHPIHGETGARLYRIWRSMKNRCYNPKHKYYSLYGGRGISMCDEWKNDYVSFRDWAVTHEYSETMSIDRIDNNKGYCPENCKFIYYKDQPKNRRTNHTVEINGEKMTASECSRRYGIPISTVIFRANRGRDILTRTRGW